ncbi:MAG: glutamate synthase large subunit [Gaiellaceae bacterium]
MATRSLYQLNNRTTERDACGIGFIADAEGRPSRRVLDLILAALKRVRHRGAVNADRLTGDGAGVLIPLSPTLAPHGGLAMVFLYEEAARATIENACVEEGLGFAGWREVPVEPARLGERARASAPTIVQAHVVAPTGVSDDQAELAAVRARKRVERSGANAYIASLSFRTVNYKALCAADQLDAFYPDLVNPEIEIPFGIFHQRFATNTTPTWERAQPFRMLCHNGEINALAGNVNWMRAREHHFGTSNDASLYPAIEDAGADSRTLDNALELLVRGGRDVRHALAMLIPEAWEEAVELDEELRDFYRYQACLIEPWDGPAGVIFTDGKIVGATLDRNGLRPLRYCEASDGLVVCASETGLVDLPEGVTAEYDMLGPGQMIAVDPLRGGLLRNEELKADLSARAPYGHWLREGVTCASTGEPSCGPFEDLSRRQTAFGYTREELSIILGPMGASGHEPTSSMGDDAAITPLSNRARPLPAYFKQRFAQVTNPAIDSLRERVVFSLNTRLGARAPLLTEGPEAARLIEIESFFLYPEGLEQLAVTRLDATFDAAEGLEQACMRLAAEAASAAERGEQLLLISDTAIAKDRAPIPILLAVGTVHQSLVRAELRTRASILVESEEPRETHHFATLLGYGADAICPRLALDTVAALAEAGKVDGDRPDAVTAQMRFRTAIEDGVLKIMSKMGIADVASYRGAEIFEAVGLADEVMKVAFANTSSAIGGVRFAELEADAWERIAEAFVSEPVVENAGNIKWRRDGEQHATTGEVIRALRDSIDGEESADLLLRRAVNDGQWEAYEKFARTVNDRDPLELRDLFELVPAGEPVPLDAVEPASEIARRFSAGAMSQGALSAEAHETLALALNMIGARSNSGEGGESLERFKTEANSRIKQVASGRFGVTPPYLRSGEELQIKIAQGAKPGEGGQLPGHKVSPEIAKLRHTEPGIALISPPPHHDIYSIEDLAQLIFDLKQSNPRADVSVKLVAEAGVGIVAAGVVKALANIVHIAGCDGGTGASPLSSIKNAGAPWELGLAETQQALVSEGLRGRVRVRVDGGFKTGRDVVVAALLGADEYSFGTALLLAEGCLMVRACHLDTCPVGVATQRPELRQRFKGTPEKVASYLLFVAEEARRQLAALGLRSIDEAIGRTDLLRQRRTGDARKDLLDLSPLLVRTGEGPARFIGELPVEATGAELGDRLSEEAARILESEIELELDYEIANGDRTVGARLGGDIGERFGFGAPPGRLKARFRGVAGQSFGAFLADGVTFELTGAANDYVGKGMNGGTIVIRPGAEVRGHPVLAGNTLLYGATGGRLYIAGRVGGRFAVRNSGAVAVVEGTAEHPCEYMTAGTVVILGEYGRNLGAGMSGGQAFVYNPDGHLELRLNPDLVFAEPLDEAAAATLRALLEEHLELTGSARAEGLLGDWETAVRDFRRVHPKGNVARLEEEHEGSTAEEAAPVAGGKG